MKLCRSAFPRLIALLLLLTQNAAHATRPLGIDVSSYQGTGVNWPTAKGGGIVFAWAKATEGQGVNDADYTYNMPNGKSAGVIMGSYHYAHPELNSAATEASHFWGRAATYTKADGLTLMPMLDVEGSAFSGHVGSTSVSDWCNDWCTDIVADGQSAGSLSLTPIIYVSACNACGFDSSVGQWGADIANYSGNSAQTSTPWTACSSCERWGSGAWDFWQYDSTGGITGYSGDIDKDVFNGTTSTLATWTVGANTNSTIYYWDPQGTTGANPYTGSMTQTWESNKWSYGSGGLATPVGWVNGKAACFGVHTGIGTPAYTITMNSSHTVAGFFDGPLTPNACDVTITGTGTINLASGPQGLDANNSSDGASAIMRIYVNIAGSGVMYPEGNGVTYLHGSNTFSGGVTLGFTNNNFTGTVYFNNGNAFGTGPITLWSHGNGGDLKLEGSSAVTMSNDFTIASATTNDIWGNSAGLTLTGDWNMSAALVTLGGGTTAGNKTILAGTLSGAHGFTVYNSGTIILTGTNTYTGTTTITSPAVLQIDGTGKLGSGSYAGAIVDGGTFIYSSTASQTLSGIISGSGPVRVADAGTLILTATNTYTGGTIVSNGGTLCVTADSGLGTAAGALTLNGGCLKNNNSAPAITSSRTITLGTSGGYVDAGWTPTNNVTLSAKLTGSGALLINLDGSAVILNNTANNFTGNTIIGTNGPGCYSGGNQALLKMGASNVIPKGSGFGSVTINSAWLGALDLNGTTQIINGLSGDGVVSNSTGTASFSVGSNNVSSTFTGTIKNTLNLTKVGTGTLMLSGTNLYTGTTTVNAGTLALGNTGSISNSSSIILAAGATLDVSAISSFVLSSSTTLNSSGTTSAATIKGGTTVSLGARPITLNYDGVHPALTISQGALSLNGNALTVNGTVLADGTYTLIQQTTGNIAASGSLTVTGTALGGKPASIAVVGGKVLLLLNVAPTVTSQPQGGTINQGTSQVFNVTASGTTPLNYQWRVNGSNISGATTTSYTKANAQSSDAGSYSVVVTNTSGSATSTDAVLVVNTFPTITAQPQSQAVNLTSNATFSVSASGTGPLTYQWRFNASNIPGATDTTYTRSNVQNGDAGSYSVVVSNFLNTATSTDAVLTINVAPSITTQPQSQSAGTGADVVFNVVAAGTDPLSYQWRKDGTSIPGANNSSYARTSITANDVGAYSVIVSNIAGTVTSTNASLAINTCAISLQSINVSPGINASLSFNVDPANNYAFQSKDNLTDNQWHDVSTVSSASSTLTITDLSVTNSQKFYRLASDCTSTPAAGFISLSLLGNSDTFISLPFVRTAASSATVVSYSDNVVTVAQANGQPWTTNQFVYVSGSQSNTYYARFASGALNGMIFPVVSNETNTLTLNLNGNTLSSVVANDLIYVEPYWSLNSVFPGGTGVNVSPLIGNRNTEILMPDLSSAGINLSAPKVYFFHAGIWKQVGQGSIDYGNDIIEPNTPFVVRHNV
ncbi:MAG: TIGR02597 family protein, partial [Limisphaerales bacterium]